ncbi:hypothetical protein AMTRI_Chr03g44800 [Amborella trichopoda]
MRLISRFGCQFSYRFCRNADKFTPMTSKWVRSDQVMYYSKLPAGYDLENFDPTEHRGPPTDRVFRLVDEISGSLVSELFEIMMKKLEMKDMPIIGMIKAGMRIQALMVRLRSLME